MNFIQHNMKKLLIVALLLASSCRYASIKGGTGDSVARGTIAQSVDNSVEVTRIGVSCTTNILGIVAFGDSSIQAAKHRAAITKISHVDTSYDAFWFLYKFYEKGCTIVKGS